MRREFAYLNYLLYICKMFHHFVEGTFKNNALLSDKVMTVEVRQQDSGEMLPGLVPFTLFGETCIGSSRNPQPSRIIYEFKLKVGGLFIKSMLQFPFMISKKSNSSAYQQLLTCMSLLNKRLKNYILISSEYIPIHTR